MSYPLAGDSKEVLNLISYALQVPGARVTCTTDHKVFTGAGFISFHRRGGTAGNGLAIDVAGTDMKAIFRKFEEQKAKLHELIHTPMGYSYKDGVKTAPIAAADHYNHVHISVKKGVMLPLSTTPSYPVAETGEHEMVGYDPISGGNWTIDETGAVFANDGAPYLGGLNGDNANKFNTHAGTNGHVVGIAAWKGDSTNDGGNGYVIVYRFNGSGEPSLYHASRTHGLQ